MDIEDYNEIIKYLTLYRGGLDFKKEYRDEIFCTYADKVIPKVTEKIELLKNTKNVLKVFNEVDSFFNDRNKTSLWFDTPNPGLGNITPNSLLEDGKLNKVASFVKTALDENKLEG